MATEFQSDQAAMPKIKERYDVWMRRAKLKAASSEDSPPVLMPNSV
jgi:hypothetical protein